MKILKLICFIFIYQAANQALNALAATVNWYGVDLMGGYQYLGSSLSDQNNLKGYFSGTRIEFQKRKLKWGEVRLALGLQFTSQTGQNNYRQQAIYSLPALFDATYSKTIFIDNLNFGFIFRNTFGTGAHYNFSNLTQFQVLPQLGPIFTYRISLPSEYFSFLTPSNGIIRAELENSFSVMRSFLTAKTVWNTPLFFGLKFTHQPKEIPIVQVTPTPPPEEPEIKKETSDIAPGSIAQLTENGMKITFPSSRIYFRTARADLSLKAKAYLGKVAKVLKDFDKTWQKLEFTGHTDSSGNAERNAKLSLRRADSFSRFFQQNGFILSRMKIRGAGSSEPAASNDTEEGMLRNRRVEILVFGDPNQLSEIINKINSIDVEYMNQSESN